MPGSALATYVLRSTSVVEPAAVAHGQPGHRHRGERRGQRPEGGQDDGRAGRGEQLVEGELGGRADRQPVEQGVRRHAEREDDEPTDERHHRPAQAPQRHGLGHPGGAVPDPGVVPGAAQSQLGEQQEEAQQHQDRRHRGRRGAVEGGAVLVVDGGGEGGEAQQGERAELGEQVQPDQQRAAEQGRSQLGQHHPGEGLPAGVPERPGGLLQRRVEAAQGRDGRAGRRAGSRTASPPARRRRSRGSSGPATPRRSR